MDTTTSTDQAVLDAWIGRELRTLSPAADPVNLPMIRHWVEAMGMPGGIHLEQESAEASGRRGPVAPAAMAQAWTMLGYAAGTDPAARSSSRGYDDLFALMTDWGYPAVVATDSEYEFERELHLGERLSVREVVESISAEKQTALGIGRFISSVKEYRDESGEVVARQRWRILRYRPANSAAAERPERPEIAVNIDNEFWFAAAQQQRLVIQRCTDCAELRHPPAPSCPSCQSFAWGVQEAAGTATLHSFVVNHHPRHPGFEYPLVVALVDLTEGTRLVTNLVGVAPDDVRIGMPLTLEWVQHSEDMTLPAFRPAPTPDSEEH